MISDPGKKTYLSQTKPLKMRWLMVGFALLATVLNYLHRLSFNYLAANDYLRDLIPDDAFGYIATCFFIAYLISNAVSGFVIDKLGTRLGYSYAWLSGQQPGYCMLSQVSFSIWDIPFPAWESVKPGTGLLPLN